MFSRKHFAVSAIHVNPVEIGKLEQMHQAPWIDRSDSFKTDGAWALGEVSADQRMGFRPKPGLLA